MIPGVDSHSPSPSPTPSLGIEPAPTYPLAAREDVATKPGLIDMNVRVKAYGAISKLIGEVERYKAEGGQLPYATTVQLVRETARAEMVKKWLGYSLGMEVLPRARSRPAVPACHLHSSRARVVAGQAAG